jgi:Rieske Fe-S protein
MSITRRDFVITGAAGGAALALPTGCGNDVVAAPLTEASVGPDSKLRVTPAIYPDLSPIGGAITVQLTNRSTGMPAALLIVHRATPGDAYEYVAMSSACTHKGCPVGYSARDVTLSLRDVPALAAVGGSQVITARGFSDPIALLRADAGTIIAVDGKCPHLCCTVGWDVAGNQWSCPCHGSIFAVDGRLTHGPSRLTCRASPSPLMAKRS